MRFTIEQRFAADVDAVARAYADPALYAALVGLPKLSAAGGASATRWTATPCGSRCATGSAASSPRPPAP